MKKITRREAMLLINQGKVVKVQVDDSSKLRKISTMEELQKEVNFEQRGLHKNLNFFYGETTE